MAYDDYEAEHHLTPSGWVVGTWKEGRLGKVVEPPEDRVLTITIDSFTQSPWKRSRRDHSGARESWRSPMISSEDIDALLEKYPRDF